MTRFRVILERPALEDIESYYQRAVSAGAGAAAARWFDRIFDAILALEDVPGWRGTVPEQEHFSEKLRQIVFEQRYRIVFTIVEDRVHVLCVRGPGMRELRPADAPSVAHGTGGTVEKESSTSRVCLDFTEEPVGHAYRELIAFLAQHGDLAGLVVRDHPGDHSEALQVLAELSPAIVDDQRVSVWPGTEIFGSTARLVRFRLDADSVPVLIERAGRLYEWLAPRMPEDLCVWRSDGSLLLATIAHEGDGWLELTRVEVGAIPASVRVGER